MQIAQIISAFVLDRSAPQPLFRQLYDAIKEAILRGALAPGMQLPPTRQFCQLLDISRQTVQNAYDQLMAEGYLQGTVGRGTFISSALPQETPASAKPASLLRPLSARGLAFAEAMTPFSYHRGDLCAFRVGMPGIDLFPFDVWSRLEARRWRRPDQHMGYSDPAGFGPLRELLCVYLKAARGVVCTPDQIVITSGSQQALFLLSTVLLAPGEAAWVESPGYRGASAPLYAGGANVFPVPVDADGMDVAYGAAHCPQAKMVVVTPSHQLPLGVTMSLARRLELLAWAGANRAWVIEDDYDSEYRYTGPPLASLQGLDRAGCTVYVGTLSKVLFPGLRLGYLVAPPALVDPLVRAKTVIDQGHFGRHIKRTREAYAERRHTLLAGIAADLADDLACGPADAGLDLCAYFRRGHDEQRIASAGAARGVELRPLSFYAVGGAPSPVPPGLLLGFAAVTPAQITHGLQVLGKLLRARR